MTHRYFLSLLGAEASAVIAGVREFAFLPDTLHRAFLFLSLISTSVTPVSMHLV